MTASGRAYFVTGTGTDVGKTVVTGALIARARRAGETVVAIKPAESGCEPGDRDGPMVARDASWLAELAGHEPLCPFRYRAPLAPAHAARSDDSPFKSSLVIALWREAQARADLILGEGAGGLLVPLAGDYLIADLVAELAAPLLVVARDDLGTINHTALTIECARARRLEVAGFVFSASAADDDDRAAANARTIAEQTGARYLGRLPRLETLSARALADAAEAHLEPI